MHLTPERSNEAEVGYSQGVSAATGMAKARRFWLRFRSKSWAQLWGTEIITDMHRTQGLECTVLRRTTALQSAYLGL